MCEDLDRLYTQAWRLGNQLYYRRRDDPRFARIYAKARARELRRGERLLECQDAALDALLQAEAESDFYRR